MEAELFFVFLFVRSVFFCPLYDVLNLCYFHTMFVQNSKNVFVKKSLIQRIYISFCTKADSFVSCVLCSDHSVFKFALISQCPGTDCNWKFF